MGFSCSTSLLGFHIYIYMGVSMNVDYHFGLLLFGLFTFGFIGLVYQGKDIVSRFIIECSSLMEIGPSVLIGLFLNEDF
jgi:hypothetical protein